MKQKYSIELILQKILTELEKRPTKDDLRNFATKDDLQHFATKDDLHNFATKDDLYTTKEDLERLIRKSGYDIEEKLVQFRSDFYTKIDPFLKEIETTREDREVSSYQTTKLQDKVDNHEQRIKKLEQKQITSY